eukprot:7971652-Karenia_brevis.AAC.1
MISFSTAITISAAMVQQWAWTWRWPWTWQGFNMIIFSAAISTCVRRGQPERGLDVISFSAAM